MEVSVHGVQEDEQELTHLISDGRNMLTMTIDSGASDNVISKAPPPQYPTYPCTVANGTTIPENGRECPNFRMGNYAC